MSNGTKLKLLNALPSCSVCYEDFKGAEEHSIPAHKDPAGKPCKGSWQPMAPVVGYVWVDAYGDWSKWKIVSVNEFDVHTGGFEEGSVTLTTGELKQRMLRDLERSEEGLHRQIKHLQEKIDGLRTAKFHIRSTPAEELGVHKEQK